MRRLPCSSDRVVPPVRGATRLRRVQGRADVRSNPIPPKWRDVFMGATVAGDRANNDPTTGLSAAIGPTPLWRLVPCDNNLGLRAVIPVPGGGHRRALEAAFENREFSAANPFPSTALMEIRPILPLFLTGRGWTMQFVNPGGGGFSLGPRDHRVIRPRLIAGADFSAADVQLAGPVAIEVIVLGDGLVVGGLTFMLDPDLDHPAREYPEESRREEREEREHKEERRHEGRGRRLKLEIDLE